MAKYDQDIQRFKALVLENPKLTLKEYCDSQGIKYSILKEAFYRRNERINELRQRHVCRKSSLSFSLSHSYVEQNIKAFLDEKGALVYITPKDANEFFYTFRAMMNQQEIIDDKLFWALYCSLWKKKNSYPTILKLLFRMFLFFIKRKGIKNVFRGTLLVAHFQEPCFRSFLEDTYCEDPNHIFQFKYKSGQKTVTTYMYIGIRNEQLLSLYIKFIENNCMASVLKEAKAISSFIEPSIGQELLNTTQFTLNEDCLFAQIHYFSNRTFNQDFRTLAIKHTVRFFIYFYEYCQNKGEDIVFRVLTPSLLHCVSLIRLLENGYTILSFSGAQKTITTLKKTIITIPELSSITTRFPNRDFITIDWTLIHNPYYRKLAIHYGLSSKRNLVGVSNLFYALAKCLNYIGERKKNGFDTLTTEDSQALRSFIITNSQSAINANNSLSLVKGLIKWAEKTKQLQVPNQISYDYFSYLYADLNSTPKAIPLEHATIIAKTLFDKGKGSPAYLHYFVLLVLLLETEFRPSQLCSIQIDRFRVIQNRDAYILQGISKVSKGDIETAAISKYSYDLLMQVLYNTHSYREDCADKNRRRFLFLYPPGVRENKQGYRIITVSRFGEIIDNICRQYGLPHYTAQNFRDAHMTFAHNYDVTNKGDGFYLRILSGHKTQLTTKEHYIDKTYNVLSGVPSGFLIGTEEELKELESRIVSKVPDSLQSAAHKTVDGIGVCSKNQCTFMTMVNCVLCPHIWYIAEQDVKPLRLMIQEIDDLLSSDISSHEREHKIQLKDALQKRLLAISSYLSKM